MACTYLNFKFAGSLGHVVGFLPVTLCNKSLNECPVYSALLESKLLPVVDLPDDFYRHQLRTFYAIPVYFPSSYGDVLMRLHCNDYSEMCKQCQEAQR